MKEGTCCTQALSRLCLRTQIPPLLPVEKKEGILGRRREGRRSFSFPTPASPPARPPPFPIKTTQCSKHCMHRARPPHSLPLAQSQREREKEIGGSRRGLRAWLDASFMPSIFITVMPTMRTPVVSSRARGDNADGQMNLSSP